ncbi:LysR family transcriptional regulator [Actinomadura sp. WMMB 499]|uniref:LysR family transcriptional regulator n=1 Tax=Actinomadura sp. WMMB 499 TaxID=1219491 RepID=UPI001244B507|nr:LysR family transcriptional regulator [Actinomadura sp. WMMB 499]QFG24545.1 LysR family transcriptional regulator [Actinomadura sp. WMMB 499]
MDLREIEIFLTLTEELHFGRTAERLHLSVARVSQAIKKQERAVGAALFERTSRSVRLTPVGEQLRDDLAPHYRGLEEAMNRAVLAARAKTELLRVGMIGGGNARDLKPLLEAFADRNPGTELQIRSLTFGDPFGPLRNGDVDVAVLWLPVKEPDLTVGPMVFTEPIVLMASSDHPFADRAQVSYEDLAGQVVVDPPKPKYWGETLIPARTPGGRPIRRGPKAGEILEVIAAVASGQMVTPVHAQTARYFARPDIVYIPIEDAPPARWALIWRNDAEAEAVRALARVIAEHGPLEL